MFFFILLVTALGFEYAQISIFFSSVFAVIGIALFAQWSMVNGQWSMVNGQWSILSNVTASLIIFFGFPYRVGDRVRIIDKKEDISGVIEEIALFHVLIKRGNELITYPNTLILQKGVIKNPSEGAQSEAHQD
ncbi:mechanosensitive ion channel domain-containing protein [Sinobacterium norvegicum]|uniref:mechanosensitive ion channel domain-containing protein n=1 Tax=Sinobacterium norvegicum TaxID=1641715 RepID=UPI001F183A66|nr:mechanosensitive ion channel domain-containing protein [Sinobacterium norvegicum]